jgi:hypothetical protein
MKPLIIRTLSALLLVACSGGLARAVTLVTSPLQLNGATTRLSCQILNVTTKQLTTRFRALDPDGDLVEDSGEFVLPAGQEFSSSFALGTGASHCTFEVKGSRNSVRASACVLQSGVGCTGVAEAR